jgi:hypothetical protein
MINYVPIASHFPDLFILLIFEADKTVQVSLKFASDFHFER